MAIGRPFSADAEIGQMVRSRVEAEWFYAGQVTLDDSGKLLVPLPKAAPGLYAFRFFSHRELMKFYVGESQDLAVRTGQYRSHTGKTNLRIRNQAVAWLEDGFEPGIQMWVSYDCQVLFEAADPGEWEPADFASKANRLVAESVALAQMLATEGDHVTVLNSLRLD